MAEMLTAKEMQSLLQVDRSTIYRMADAGRLPAIKIGGQWRFPSDLVDEWLRGQTAIPLPAAPASDQAAAGEFASLLPLACVQLIQDTFAEALEVMLVVTDLEGNPVTRISNPCGLFQAVSSIPNALQRCIDGWRELGNSLDLEPKFLPSHLGPLCARGMVRVGAELKGMVIVGCVAPDNWPPAPDEVERIAADFSVEPEELAAHIDEVFYLDEVRRAWLLPFVQRIANIISHIASERHTLMGKLETIAKITTLK